MRGLKHNRKSLRLFSVMLLLCSGLLTGCIPADESAPTDADIRLIQLEPPKEGQDIAIFETTRGTIRMMLFSEQTPQTVAHFKTLINAGFYDDRPIAKIDPIAKTMFTGIDETTDTNGRVMTENGKDVPLETDINLWHFPGAVSAYQNVSGFNSRYTNSDSRFFIVGSKKPADQTIYQLEEQDYPKVVQDAYQEHGGLLEYTGCFTVFAQVYEGMDIVDDIIDNTELQPGTVIPKEEIVIRKAVLSTYTSEPETKS